MIGGIPVGGVAQFSGAIRGEKIESVAIAGSLIGAAGKTSGAIISGNGEARDGLL